MTIDEEVGKLVMGYEGDKQYICTDGSGICASVDRVNGPRYSEYKLREWLSEKQAAGYCLQYRIEEVRRFEKYTTDPAADYSVLEKVRKTWDLQQIRALSASLRYIWHERKEATPYPMETFYQPGDYSRAALAVLKAKDGGA